MVEFVRTPNGSYRMRRNGSDVIAVHQVLRTNVCRPIAHVLCEMRPGQVFIGEQVPAPNTYLHLDDTLTRDAVFPFPHTLRDECSHDRLSLLICEILEGASSLEPIETDPPIAYCVGAGIIDEVHVETTPERYEHYRTIIGDRLVFHERQNVRSYLLLRPSSHAARSHEARPYWNPRMRADIERSEIPFQPTHNRERL